MAYISSSSSSSLSSSSTVFTTARTKPKLSCLPTPPSRTAVSSGAECALESQITPRHKASSATESNHQVAQMNHLGGSASGQPPGAPGERGHGCRRHEPDSTSHETPRCHCYTFTLHVTSALIALIWPLALVQWWRTIAASGIDVSSVSNKCSIIRPNPPAAAQ